MVALLDQFGRPMGATKETAIAELRAAAGQIKLRAAYDAAQTTRDNSRHWRFADDLSAASANTLAVRKILRTRSRYECLQNNAFGRGIANTLATDFVSTGPRLQIETTDQALKQRIERRWHEWTRAVKLNKKLRTARLTKTVDGEAFLMAITNPRLRTPVQLDIRGIEADQISTPGWADGLQRGAVDGVRFDTETGEPIEYDLLNEHPGDRGFVGSLRTGSRQLDARDVIHLFATDRPGQCRGIPELTPSLPLFAYLRRFTLATIQSAETAASYAAVIETQAGAFEDAEEQAEIFESFSTVEIERGMMAALPFGYKLSQLKAEQPTTGYVTFRDAILCEIARPVNMPRNKVLGDSSGYNFSSSRVDHQIYYHGINVERADWEIEALDRIFEWWMDEAVFIPGYIDLPPATYVSRRWTWPQPASVNPLQDAQTAIALIDAGLRLESDYLAEQQIDPEEFYAARDREDTRRHERLRLEQIATRGETAPPVTSPGFGDPNQTTGDASAVTDAAPPPPSEFANMKRSQLINNNKAIDDALGKLGSGEWTVKRARVFLASVGLTAQTIDALLDGYEDPDAEAADETADADAAA
jgi:lambda family phage portal protein